MISMLLVFYRFFFNVCPFLRTLLLQTFFKDTFEARNMAVFNDMRILYSVDKFDKIQAISLSWKIQL